MTAFEREGMISCRGGDRPLVIWWATAWKRWGRARSGGDGIVSGKQAREQSVSSEHCAGLWRCERAGWLELAVLVT